MKRLLLLAAASITLSAPAFAQAYQCVGGELLGGPANYGCETNAQGKITSVGPRTSAPTRATTTVRRAMPAPVTTTRRAAPMVTHSPAPRVTHRTQAPIQYARPSTTTTTRTVTSTHAPTRTYSQSHSHGAGQPLTHTHSHTHYNHAPVTTHRPVTRTYSAPVRTYSQPTTTYSRPIYTPPPRVAAVRRATCDEAYTRLNDASDGRKRYEVCYADLTPVTVATADDIYDRISSAARKACRGGTSLFGNDRSCRRDAIYRAVVDVNLPALDSYYANKSGRYVPRVTVGPLRRN